MFIKVNQLRIMVVEGFKYGCMLQNVCHLIFIENSCHIEILSD